MNNNNTKTPYLPENIQKAAAKLAGILVLCLLGYGALLFIIGIALFVVKIFLAIIFTHAILIDNHFASFRSHFSILVKSNIQQTLFNYLICPPMNALISIWNTLLAKSIPNSNGNNATPSLLESFKSLFELPQIKALSALVGTLNLQVQPVAPYTDNSKISLKSAIASFGMMSYQFVAGALGWGSDKVMSVVNMFVRDNSINKSATATAPITFASNSPGSRI